MTVDGREGGFIVLHRRIRSWPLWQSLTAEQRMVIVELLLAANWTPSEFWRGSSRVAVDRGQLVHAEETIAMGAGVSRHVVRRVLEKLESEGFISREKGPHTGRHPRVTTIVNYKRYQDVPDRTGPQTGPRRANKGPITGQQGAPSEPSKQEEQREPYKPKKLLASGSEDGGNGDHQANGPAPASTPFVQYVRAQWPDVKDPQKFEQLAREAFPAVDLLAEARKAFGWERSDVANRKVKHGTFLWNWFTRAQNGASQARNGANGHVRQVSITPGRPEDFAGKGGLVDIEAEIRKGLL